MNEAVFISDLHLHPNEPEITQKFVDFIDWAKKNTQSLYILGDFFHVWVGDDLITDFEISIAKLLLELHALNIPVYFMPGNRDFLLGDKFLKLAKMHLLPDPCVISLKGIRIFLTHGDAYCLHDKAHQFLRRLTRPKLMKSIFLAFPKTIRASIVHRVRNLSRDKKIYTSPHHKKYQVVKEKLFQDMQRHQVYHVIYGHVHHPQHTQHLWKNRQINEFILSDWDQKPRIVCYNLVKGLSLSLMSCGDVLS